MEYVNGRLEDVGREEFERTALDIKSKLYDSLDKFNNPLEFTLLVSSIGILTDFRTKSSQSYDKSEFLDQIPKELRFFIDREPAIYDKEINYHNERVKYIKDLSKQIEKNPGILKSYEIFLLYFFTKNMRLNPTFSNSMSNAALQIAALENNIGDLYFLLSTKKFGFKKYISGIKDSGEIFSKLSKKLKLEEIPMCFSNIHSHATTFLSLDPEPFQELIPNGATWANDKDRFNGCISEDHGKLGVNMLMLGQEKKHFHSSLPYDVIINHRNIKKIIVKDDPPRQIYFSTTFSDGSISISTMSSPNENDLVVQYNSDLFSDFIQHYSVKTLNSAFLFDLAGCIARDMFVLEERNKYYSISEVKAKSEKVKKKKNIKEKIIWLPRFKLNFHGDRDEDLEDKIISLSPSHVSGHPRKCENPNEKQLELAKKLGIKLPLGYTYVKEHDRGGSVGFERSYKSRSAMKLIYGS